MMEDFQQRNLSSMVYLLGISHKFQWKKDLPNAREFKDYLKKKSKSLKIDLIAEEFSEEGLKKNKIKNTIPQEVAEDLNITHKFCEPNKEDLEKIGWISYGKIKKRLGFDDPILAGSPEDKAIIKEQRKFYYIRETYWLKQLEQYKNKNILFICGKDHIHNSNSLKSLLNEFGFNYKILPQRFTGWWGGIK